MSLIGAGMYDANSTSSSGKSNETGVRVGTSGSAALVVGGNYYVSFKYFIRNNTDDE